jgi:hypothetical protein
VGYLHLLRSRRTRRFNLLAKTYHMSRSRTRFGWKSHLHSVIGPANGNQLLHKRWIALVAFYLAHNPPCMFRVPKLRFAQPFFDLGCLRSNPVLNDPIGFGRAFLFIQLAVHSHEKALLGVDRQPKYGVGKRHIPVAIRKKWGACCDRICRVVLVVAYQMASRHQNRCQAE